MRSRLQRKAGAMAVYDILLEFDLSDVVGAPGEAWTEGMKGNFLKLSIGIQRVEVPSG